MKAGCVREPTQHRSPRADLARVKASSSCQGCSQLSLSLRHPVTSMETLSFCHVRTGLDIVRSPGQPPLQAPCTAETLSLGCFLSRGKLLMVFHKNLPPASKLQSAVSFSSAGWKKPPISFIFPSKLGATLGKAPASLTEGPCLTDALTHSTWWASV